MRVLAIDTTMAACSAAVATDGDVLAARLELIGRGHAERLMPMVEAVRAEAALDYRDLDGLAVTLGPGTFTGVRVGVAAARALRLATGLPLAGVGSLQAMAWGRPSELPLLVAVDARRGALYVQLFGPGGEAREAASLAPPEALAGRGLPPAGRIIGSGAVQAAAALPGWRAEAPAALPDAAVVAVRLSAGAADRFADAPLSPVYLRAPDAKLPAGPTDC